MFSSLCKQQKILQWKVKWIEIIIYHLQNLFFEPTYGMLFIFKSWIHWLQAIRKWWKICWAPRNKNHNQSNLAALSQIFWSHCSVWKLFCKEEENDILTIVLIFPALFCLVKKNSQLKVWLTSSRTKAKTNVSYWQEP